MEQWQRDYHVSQIISGTIYCQLGNKSYIYHNTSPTNKYIANKIYKQIYESSKDEGIYDEDDILGFMFNYELWSVEEEEKLNQMIGEIDDLKIKIFELKLQSVEREMVRKGLNDTRAEINQLHAKKHSYDHLTCHGIAYGAKQRYIIGSSITDINGKPYWKNPSGWSKPDKLLNAIIYEINENNLGEKEIRELARTDPWKSIWLASKYSGKGVFDLSGSQLTENQKGIILYAQMYDNILESPEYPGDEVAEDDDMLDGWMLLQRRKNKSEQEKEDIISRVKNEKIRGSEEIFIPVNTVEDAKKVQGAMDIAGKIAFKQRMKQIKEEGVVQEADLKETRMRLQMQFAQQLRGE